MSERLTEGGVARLGAVPVLSLVPGLVLGLIVRSSAPRFHRATQHLQVGLKSRGHRAGRRRLPQLLHLRAALGCADWAAPSPDSHAPWCGTAARCHRTGHRLTEEQGALPPPATRVGAGGLQHRAHRAARVRQPRVGPPADQGGAGGGAYQPEQHAQGGGFAGAVGAKEPGDVRPRGSMPFCSSASASRARKWSPFSNHRTHQ